jgi:hypothetical protein
LMSCFRPTVNEAQADIRPDGLSPRKPAATTTTDKDYEIQKGIKRCPTECGLLQNRGKGS